MGDPASEKQIEQLLAHASTMEKEMTSLNKTVADLGNEMLKQSSGKMPVVEAKEVGIDIPKEEMETVSKEIERKGKDSPKPASSEKEPVKKDAGTQFPNDEETQTDFKEQQTQTEANIEEQTAAAEEAASTIGSGSRRSSFSDAPSEMELQ